MNVDSIHIESVREQIKSCFAKEFANDHDMVWKMGRASGMSSALRLLGVIADEEYGQLQNWIHDQVRPSMEKSL